MTFKEFIEAYESKNGIATGDDIILLWGLWVSWCIFVYACELYKVGDKHDSRG